MAAFQHILASFLSFFTNLFHRRTASTPASNDIEANPKDGAATPDTTEVPVPASAEPQPKPEPESQPAKTLTAAEVFDSVGPAYEDAFTGLPTQAAAIDWLVQQLKASPATAAGGAKIVDVGCGTGRPACSVLADAGHDVLGIDISEEMLKAARARVPNATFELIDVRAFIERQKAHPESLDAVTVFFSLIAGVTQDDIRAVLSGLAGLLKPGGFLVFSTVPIPVNNESIKWMGRPVVVSSLSPEEGVAAVKAAGLEVKYDAVTKFKPQGAEVGICQPDEVWEESHLFVYAQKPVAEAAAVVASA
ncbi:hypothetical protein SCUCBS95973_007794 [Sporothrix curviconia]|uniref:Methyltransferase domain-containing protein n=1 Tax=Sporothrix curviconia TaxID=1260050 RepID=A0ABP0CG69_9PEZI